MQFDRTLVIQPVDPKTRMLLQSIGVFPSRDVFGYALSMGKIPDGHAVFYLPSSPSSDLQIIGVIGRAAPSGLAHSLERVNLCVRPTGFEDLDDQEHPVYRDLDAYAKSRNAVVAKPRFAFPVPAVVLVRTGQAGQTGQPNEVVCTGGRLCFEDGETAGFFVLPSTSGEMPSEKLFASLRYVRWNSYHTQTVVHCTRDDRQVIFTQHREFYDFLKYLAVLHGCEQVNYDSLVRVGLGGGFAPRSANADTDFTDSAKSPDATDAPDAPYSPEFLSYWHRWDGRC